MGIKVQKGKKEETRFEDTIGGSGSEISKTNGAIKFKLSGKSVLSFGQSSSQHH